ncbi:MAG TPA: MFS transporter, partial [Terriglobales bacterium]|nr:MFS transporter [Terriglobales bacterium]
MLRPLEGKSVPAQPRRDRILINAAGFLRSLGVGLVGVVLGIYLFRVGFSSVSIGLVVAAGLAGTALATLLVSLFADRFGRRQALILLAILSAVGGIALAFVPVLPLLLPTAFLTMLNGTGSDRSASYALEQGILPGLAPDARRTWNLAWYNVLLDGGGSLGALGASLPILLQRHLQVSMVAAYKSLFLGYAGLWLVVAVLATLLSPAVEVVRASQS